MALNIDLVEDESQTIDQQLQRKSDQLHTSLHNYINRLPLNHDPVTVTKIIKSINEFELQPTLLDSHLKLYISRLCQIFINESEQSRSGLTSAAGNIVYNLAKVRGFKVLTQYFDSDVYTVVTLLELLKETHDENELFLIQMWFCNLILVPFELNQEIVEKSYDVILQILLSHSNGSKNQIVSLMLLCNFLSRADLIEAGYLQKYLTTIFDEWSGLRNTDKLSHLMVVNKLMKRLPLEQVVKYNDRLFETMQLELLLLKTKDVNNINLLYLIKVLSKIGEVTLQQLNFLLLQQIITILIDIVQSYNESFEINLRYAMAKALSRINNRLTILAPNYQQQLFLYLLNLLEVDLLLPLSSELSEEKTPKFRDITINFDTVSIPKFHTILLFIGYTALGKSLPLHLISLVLSIAHKTLFANQKRININIGNQLKDASCFVVWAILKNMKRVHYELCDEALHTIFLDLTEVTVFDSDIVIRRCAIAVLQEFVGRFGTLSFKVNDLEIRGEKIVNFIELFTNSAVSLTETSLSILDGLLDIGFSKGLTLWLLLENLEKCKIFGLQVLYSNKLMEILLSDYRQDLDIGVAPPIINANIIEQRYDQLENSLYFKSELWAKLNKPFIALDLLQASEESSLKYLEFCCLSTMDLEPWRDSLLLIVKSKRDISNSFNKFLTTASQTRTDLSWFIREACHNMTPMLSRCIFNYHQLDQTLLERLFKIMHAAHVDYEIRTNLLRGFNANFGAISVDKRLVTNLTHLLNDYTTTEQGDVGSKIRGAILDIVSEHFEAYSDSVSILEPCLIRIAGESMETLRFKSFNLLLKLRGVEQWTNLTSIREFYQGLFEYYNLYIFGSENSVEFLRGLAFSAGGLTGDSANLNASFRALLLFVQEEDKLSTVLQQLVSLLTKRKLEPQRVLKEYVVTLNLINKLIEAGIVIPANLLNAMFVKAYNLQINTSQVIRIKLTINLMKHLALMQEPTLKLKSLKRLLWLLQNHKLEVVRRFALQLIFDIVLSEDLPLIEHVETLDLDDKEVLQQFEGHILCLWKK